VAIVDYFLKIEGIKGESQDSKHKDEIEIESFSWGAVNMGTASHGGGMGAGRVQFQDFNFTMRVNKASPDLMMYCATGTHVKSALLTCRKAGKDQQEYLKVTFSDLLISSYQTNGTGSAGVIPMDQVAFNFSKIEYAYQEQKADGTLGGAIKKWYDMKTVKGG
jgi:type VI secretion system secreted protein Hcp